MSEHRDSPRIPMKTRIRITHESIGEIETTTRDISNSGVFLFMEDIALPDIGAIVQGQVQGLPGGDAPIVDMEVVRMEPEGIGLRYVRDEE